MRLPFRLACVGYIVVLLSSGKYMKIAQSGQVDLTTFTSEYFPHSDSNGDPNTDFSPLAEWSQLTTAEIATHMGNSSPSVFYSPWNSLDKRISGGINGGSDDDVIGFVVGFQPGSATMGDPAIDAASYLLIDWKRTAQTFNFADFAVPSFTPFHNLTGMTSSAMGLALSRVDGLPTGDELWGHTDLAENTLGGVTELARATTLGQTGYGVNTTHSFDLFLTATRLIFKIDGIEQFNISGAFSEGRFGLYTNLQGTATSAAQFSNLVVDEIVSGDFDGNGVVDGADFLLWQRQFGATGSLAADGDGNGTVDALDLQAWQAGFGLSANVNTVPEPRAIALIGIASIAGAAWRRSRLKGASWPVHPRFFHCRGNRVR